MVQLLKEKDGKPCHIYEDDLLPWVRFSSVSKVKAHLMPYVDWDAKAASASSNPRSRWFGMGKAAILAEWQKLKTDGCAYGDVVHSSVEAHIKAIIRETFTGGCEPVDAFEERVVRSFERVLAEFPKPDRIATEEAFGMQVCDRHGRTVKVFERMRETELVQALIDPVVFPRHKTPFQVLSKMDRKALVYMAARCCMDVGLAGTVDIPFFLDDFSFLILDIKTDKELKMQGFRGETMVGPLSHVQACSWEQYCLQLETYAILMEKNLGMDYKGGYVLHWLRDEERFVVRECPNRRKEAVQALAHFYKIGPYKKMREEQMAMAA